MLLRRFTQHVKDQNWTAIGLDFVIVVLGVFIGIQVSNWNESRAEKDRMAAQLASFRDELVLARDDLAEFRLYLEDRVESTAELRRQLESGDAFHADDFNRLTVSAIRGSGLNVTFRGYEELTSTGAVSKVAEEHLRDLLYEWDTSLTRIKNTDQTLEDTRNNVIIPHVLNATALGNVLQADERYSDLIVPDRFEFSMETIRANRAFDSALAIRHVQAKQQLNTLADFIDLTERLITALDEGVSK